MHDAAMLAESGFLCDLNMHAFSPMGVPLCICGWSKGKWFSEEDWIRNRISCFVLFWFYSIYKKNT